MYDICCIGHITNDKVVTPQSVNYLPGGTAWYFSCALSRLPTSCILATALATAEIRYAEILEQKGITVDVQPSAHTVFFENIYTDNPDERTQNVLQTADPFTPQSLQPVEASIYHLGPLLTEDIPVELIGMLAGRGLVSLDAQGYLRRLQQGKVYQSGWPHKAEALQHVHILKVDVGELRVLTGCNSMKAGAAQVAALGVREVVITNGSSGSSIYSGERFYNIPAFAPKKVVDATGCGDTYMAGYLYRRSKGDDIQEAGEFAAAMAGLKTAASGAFEGTEEEIRQFMACF